MVRVMLCFRLLALISTRLDGIAPLLISLQALSAQALTMGDVSVRAVCYSQGHRHHPPLAPALVSALCKGLADRE